MPTADRGTAGPSLQDDEKAIGRILAAYQRGYTTLDADAVRKVWPRVNGEELRNAFGQLESQRIEFAACSVEVSSLNAAATCRGTATYVPKVGSGEAVRVQRTWRFSLHRFGDGWLIDSAVAR
jgi:hypothetical protein